MIINAVIVLYNPKDEFVSRYVEMSSYFDNIFFIDNSVKYNDNLINQIKAIKNAKYVSLEGNKGIAFALNKGLEEATKEKCDYVLTMDQDSRFPIERMEDIKDILAKKLDSNYGIISVNYNSPETTLEIREVPWWITSGNFINAKKCLDNNIKFNSDLFIDGVDQDFCHSMKDVGLKIGLIPGVSLKHQIGNPVTHRILWKKFSTFNYPLFRYYYLFRNYYYLYKTDKKFYKNEYKKIKYFQPFKILFYEKDKRAKFRAAKLGKKDAKKGLLGECPHKL